MCKLLCVYTCIILAIIQVHVRDSTYILNGQRFIDRAKRDADWETIGTTQITFQENTNGSGRSVNTTNSDVTTHILPTWISVMDLVEVSVTLCGAMANAATYIALVKHGQAFSPVIRLLLRHQSAMDGLVCIVAISLLAAPSMLMVGDNYFSLLICQIWHSQSIL